MPMEQQVMVIYAATQGHLDDIPVPRIQEFQNGFLAYLDASFASLRSGLVDKKELTSDIENGLKQALNDFKSKMWKK